MTDQDMKNLEAMFQRYTDQYRSGINLKLDQLLEIIEATCCDLQKYESNRRRLAANERR